MVGGEQGKLIQTGVTARFGFFRLQDRLLASNIEALALGSRFAPTQAFQLIEHGSDAGKRNNSTKITKGVLLSGPWTPVSHEGQESVLLLERGDFGFLTGKKPAVYNASCWEVQISEKGIRWLSEGERRGLIDKLALKLIERYFR